MRSAPHQDNSALGITFVLSAMFIFATQDAITKHLAGTYAAPQILWVRFAFYTLFALAYSARKKPLRYCLRSAVPWLQVARSLLIVAEIAVFIAAVRFLNLADIHALFATFPLMVTAIAAVFLGEKVGVRRWTAVFAGFVGVLIIVRPGFEEIKPGTLLALLTAFMFAVYNIMTRVVAHHDDSETTTVYMAVVGVACLSVLAPFYWVPPTPTDWAWLFCLSCTAAAGHFLLIKALEYAPASTLQPFNFTLLVFATFIGFVAFGTLPDFWTVVGAAVVVASGLYTIYRERVRRASADDNAAS